MIVIRLNLIVRQRPLISRLRATGMMHSSPTAMCTGMPGNISLSCGLNVEVRKPKGPTALGIANSLGEGDQRRLTSQYSFSRVGSTGMEK